MNTNKIDETYRDMAFAEFYVVAIIGKHGPLDRETLLPEYVKAKREHCVYPAKEPLPDVLAMLTEREVLSVSGNPDKDDCIYALTELGKGIYMRMYHKDPVPQA